MQTLVLQMLNLMSSDAFHLNMIRLEMENPAWLRRKYRKAALDIILNRWCDDESISQLVDELLQLTTPGQWKQWVQESQQMGVRVDIWKKQVEMRMDMPQCAPSHSTSSLLGFWIGEERAQSVSSQLYPRPGGWRG